MTFQVRDHVGWLIEVETENDLFDLCQEMADDQSLFGGWLIEDNQIVAYCDGDICDVCDGHTIGVIRSVFRSASS